MNTIFAYIWIHSVHNRGPAHVYREMRKRNVFACNNTTHTKPQQCERTVHGMMPRNAKKYATCCIFFLHLRPRVQKKTWNGVFIFSRNPLHRLSAERALWATCTICALCARIYAYSHWEGHQRLWRSVSGFSARFCEKINVKTRAISSARKVNTSTTTRTTALAGVFSSILLLGMQY